MNYLMLLTSANVIKYIHLLLDILHCLGCLSAQFQHRQSNVSVIMTEIQASIDLLNKYLTSPGPSLRKILEGDTTIFQGEKLSNRNNAFMAARYDILTYLITSLKKRYNDMASTVLQNSWILDFKLWPAEYTGNGGFRDTAVGALALSLEKTLREAEVDPTKLEDEWDVLKCYLYKMSKISPVSKLSWQQINESYREKCGSFLHLVDLLLSIPTSPADVERSFNQVKLIKFLDRLAQSSHR
ncbi:hypothetical protein Hamer_G010883 [Homarus americanus]|uniref:Uncharacterized protein n=1 Tax=Homarus americanus TaxID=6706 RepID=A0A8J5JVW4_HOMAM|nr:hypothetical protein Hamer_G010883 [Homarus americanus]